MVAPFIGSALPPFVQYLSLGFEFLGVHIINMPPLWRLRVPKIFGSNYTIIGLGMPGIHVHVHLHIASWYTLSLFHYFLPFCCIKYDKN